ncbi:MAG: HTH-type transcriptional regulator CynR [Nitrospira sp.]|nr:MAG: HTH-type transcriptional regulator CynR [Nitrospira sp.]
MVARSAAGPIVCSDWNDKRCLCYVPPVELRHLRYFLAAADALHFTKAAAQAHVSQPALSAQIKQLEEEVATPLFERVGRSVRLTRAGEIFRGHATRALREIEAALTAIAEEEELHRGAVTVGVLQTVHAYLAPNIVASFSARHPHISLKLEELSGPEIEQGVLDGLLDVGVGFSPPAAEGLETQLLFEDDFVLIASRRHRLARRKRIAFAALAGEPLVLLSPAYCVRQLVDGSFRAANTAPKIAIEMNSIEGILATVRSGAMATILPRFSLGRGRDATLSVIGLTHPRLKRGVGLLWRRGGYRSAASKALAEQVRATVDQYWRS